MAFRLNKSEPVNAGVARIIREQIEAILNEQDQTDLPAARKVHNARKSCKMIRGALRLVRGRFDEFERENKVFRDAARLLAGSRQSTALGESFEKLRDWIRQEKFGVNLDRLRIIDHVLQSHAAADSMQSDVPEAFITMMRDARQRSEEWKIRGRSFAAIQDGLKQTYKEGQTAMKLAMKETTVENLHEWRKVEKYHWYHVRILEPIWKPMLKARIKQLENLSDLLGEDHDLAMLRLELEKHQTGTGSDLNAAIGEVMPLIDKRQADFRRRAFRSGQRVYAESPGEMVDRLKDYWKVWTEE